MGTDIQLGHIMFAANLRTSTILGATSTALVLILATSEAHILITGHALPTPIRMWLMWGSLAGAMLTVNSTRNERLEQVRRNQTELIHRIDQLDKLLDDGGGMRGLIRSELHEALSRGELTDAVERVLAPTLEAAQDYRDIRHELATVTRLPQRN